jgi:phosphoribosylaminoimidazolecarboxamide formyltransferase/IMP cyclohydrolase
MSHALLSVSDKTGIVEFARGLVSRGYTVVSTGGTARALAASGVPITAVSDLTGMPEMMDGRVKTLHPKIHGGILARRDHPTDLDAVRELGISLIDIVAVNLYPFARAAANPDLAVDLLVEEIDIGGPSLVRGAAKNFRDVLVVVDPGAYETVLGELDRPGGPSLGFRLSLAQQAFAHTAGYDSTIASALATIGVEDGRLERGLAGGPRMPAHLGLDLQKVRDLRYGENPHQAGAWYRAAPGTGGTDAPIEIIQGKELSFTNLLDLDSAARIVAEFVEPAGVVIKHTNPCGAAVGRSAEDAYVRARDADPLAAFGGIVGLNRVIDEATARAIASTFIEAVIAPGVEEAAIPLLAAKKNMRVVLADIRGLADETGRLDLRSIFCGTLAEERDRVLEMSAAAVAAAGTEGGLRIVTTRPPTAEEWRALAFAWRVCAHVKSNAVIFTDAERTMAIGAGQMSRVDAVQVAVMKAVARYHGEIADGKRSASVPLAGSVAASDAFFPFRDGLDGVAAAGATAVIQPGGSVRDAEVIAAANEHGLAMVFAGKRHFRH